MSRILIALYGGLAYLGFLVTFLYAIGFIMSLGVPKAVNDGPEGPVWLALLVNLGLMSLFAVQHSIMARPWFKQRWTRIVPKAMERATFVVATCIVLGLLYWLWRPIPMVIWRAGDPVTEFTLIAISVVGWLMVLYSSFLIDHFDLFGLRQVLLHLRRRPYIHRPFAVRSLYRLVRHPLMLGFLIAFWSTPLMTGGHLLFAAVVTAYIVVALQFEERDLVRHLGEDYVAYKRRTPMLLPRLIRRSTPAIPITESA
ncbi:MAG: hypothetical protein KDA21_03115 [Phycisphaerales bacterium]|nr:hypothetical protein [Phycisphaerales bacterium]